MQMLDCVALLLILATAGLLLATPAFHQIAEAGRATPRLINRASVTLQMALVPLALALGIDLAIGLTYHRIAANGNFFALALVGDAHVTVQMITDNSPLALALGVIAAVAFALLLYGLPLAVRWSRNERAAGSPN